MKFLKTNNSNFSIEITPLIDIVFLLVIFFVVTSKVGDSQFLSLELPKTESFSSNLVKESNEISILSEPNDIEFDSEEDLLSKMVPFEDGLILISGNYQGTFLPSVWAELPEPKNFLNHLKLKAGLATDYWSDDIIVKRYRVLEI